MYLSMVYKYTCMYSVCVYIIHVYIYIYILIILIVVVYSKTVKHIVMIYVIPSISMGLHLMKLRITIELSQWNPEIWGKTGKPSGHMFFLRWINHKSDFAETL